MSINVWNSLFGIGLRWVLFLPIGLALQSLLSAIPGLVCAWLFPLRIESVFWRYAAGLGIAIAGFSVLMWLGALAYVISRICCRYVAPSLRVAQVVYGGFLVLFGVSGLIYGLMHSYGVVVNTYNVAVCGVCLLGVIHAGRES